jgi:hypothetical protein
MKNYIKTTSLSFFILTCGNILSVTLPAKGLSQDNTDYMLINGGALLSENSTDNIFEQGAVDIQAFGFPPGMDPFNPDPGTVDEVPVGNAFAFIMFLLIAYLLFKNRHQMKSLFRKKSLFTLFIVLLGFSANAATTYNWEGSGTESNPYQVKAIAEFQRIQSDVNNGIDSYEGKYFVLATNIALPSGNNAWTPIGSTERPFRGNFNGDNHTITCPNNGNSYFGRYSYVGIWGYMENGSISNLKIDYSGNQGNGTVQTSGERIGGLIGSAKNSTIANCQVSCSKSNIILGGTQYIGGLIGYADDCSINNSLSTLYVCSYSGGDKACAGGLIGYLNTGTKTSTGSSASGNVSTNWSGACKIGGVIGYCTGQGVIDGFFTTAGNVVGSQGDYHVGGLIGYAENISSATPLTIKNCYVSEEASTATAQSRLGGLIGEANGNITVTKCTTSGPITGINNAYQIGGLIGLLTNKTNYQVKIIACSSDVEITGRYNLGGFIGEVDGYVQIKNSYSKGRVNGSVTYAEQCVGGFIGKVNFTGEIDNCYAEVDVDGENYSNYAGGFMGYVSTEAGVIANCFSHAGDVAAGVQSQYVGGLIGYLENTATIQSLVKNCGVKACNIKNAYWNTGGVFGYIKGNFDLEKCYADSIKVTTTQGWNGNVNQTGTGGLIGYATGYINMTNCYAIGITDDSPAATSVNKGGLAGYMKTKGTLRNCYSSGQMTDGQNAGGLIGYAIGLSMDSCHTDLGLVLKTNNGISGGMIGRLEDPQLISHCYTEGYILSGMTPAKNASGMIGLLVKNADSGTTSIEHCFSSFYRRNRTDVGKAAEIGGGLIAEIDNKDTTNPVNLIACYFRGIANGLGVQATQYGGGIVGKITGKFLIDGCVTGGRVVAETGYAGAMVGYIDGTGEIRYTINMSNEIRAVNPRCIYNKSASSVVTGLYNRVNENVKLIRPSGETKTPSFTENGSGEDGIAFVWDTWTKANAYTTNMGSNWTFQSYAGNNTWSGNGNWRDAPAIVMPYMPINSAPVGIQRIVTEEKTENGNTVYHRKIQGTYSMRDKPESIRLYLEGLNGDLGEYDLGYAILIGDELKDKDGTIIADGTATGYYELEVTGDALQSLTNNSYVLAVSKTKNRATTISIAQLPLKGVWYCTDAFGNQIGDGSAAKPYCICDESSLRNMATNVNENLKEESKISHAESHFYLANDIKLTSEDWIPIGRSVANNGVITKNPFKGKFDGKGNTIQVLDLTSDSPDAGLFGYLQGATITNLGLNTGSVGIISDHSTHNHTSGYYPNTGTLAGTQDGGLIEKVVIWTQMKVGRTNAGGLVGRQINNGLIDQCYVYSTIVDKNTSNIDVDTDKIGGLVGYQNGGQIRNSFVHIHQVADQEDINENATPLSGIRFGALVGVLEDVAESEETSVAITNKIETSYVENHISRGGIRWESQLVGNIPDTDTRIQKCINFMDKKIDPTEAKYKTLTYYIENLGWNSDIWAIREGISYPYLKVQSAPAQLSRISNKCINGNSASTPEKVNMYGFKENGYMYLKGQTIDITAPKWKVCSANDNILDDQMITVASFDAGKLPPPLIEHWANYVHYKSIDKGNDSDKIWKKSYDKGTNWSSDNYPLMENLLEYTEEVTVNHDILYTNTADKELGKLSVSTTGKFYFPENTGYTLLVDTLEMHSNPTQSGELLTRDASDLNITGMLRIYKEFPVAGRWEQISIPFSAQNIYNIKNEPIAIDKDYFVYRYSGEKRAIDNYSNGTAGVNWVLGRGENDPPLPVEDHRGYMVGCPKAQTLIFEIPANKNIATPFLWANVDAKNMEWNHPVTWNETLAEWQNDLTIKPYNKGWNLMGNPYFATFDLANLAPGPDGKKFICHVHNPKKNTYEVIDLKEEGKSYLLPPYGTFFIQVEPIKDSIAADNYFDFESFYTVPETNSLYSFRGGEAEKKEVRINLTFGNTAYTDQFVLTFDEEATDAYDINRDATKTTTTAYAQIYNPYNGLILAINALPWVESKTIPLTCVAPTAGTYTFTYVEKSGSQHISKLVLRDKTLQTETNLLESSTYQVLVTKNNAITGRFELYVELFQEGDNPSTGSGDGAQTDEGNNINISIQKQNLVISGLETDASVKINDLMGRTVASYHHVRNNEVLSTNLSGIYIVEVKSGQESVVRKVILN